MLVSRPAFSCARSLVHRPKILGYLAVNYGFLPCDLAMPFMAALHEQTLSMNNSSSPYFTVYPAPLIHLITPLPPAPGHSDMGYHHPQRGAVGYSVTDAVNLIWLSGFCFTSLPPPALSLQ